MCGRFQLTLPVEALRDLFACDVEGVAPFPPRYNIAPTQPIHVVHQAADGARRLSLMRWGLIPSFVKDPAGFPLLINARSESAADKPAFRNAVRRRRLVVPATGTYEWAKEGAAKQPYVMRAGDVMALAGLFECWHGPNGEEMDTAALLTANAVGEAARLHTRMPVTVPLDRLADWLDPALDDGAAALALTDRPAVTLAPVSRRLGNARLESAGLMVPEDAREAGDGGAATGAKPGETGGAGSTGAREPRTPKAPMAARQLDLF